MAASNAHALYYSDELMINLQLRYGEGLMSPGGAAELERLLGGADLAGRRGLDVGCGLGGYDELLVRAHGVGHVTGVDVNATAIDHAQRRTAAAGLADRLTFLAVDDGALPFADGAFDFAFSKDSIVDMPEKAPVLAEIHRLLAPGGRLFVSDWFRADAPYTPEMRAWATTGDETYEMASLRATADELAAAGFVEVETEDRGAWFVEFCRDERDRLAGALKPIYEETFGAASAARSLANAETRLLLAEQGQLLTGHLRARKPL
jgi:phosphoethanolamine N-methyltransferase